MVADTSGLDLAHRHELFGLYNALKYFLVFPEGSADLAAGGSYPQIVAVSWSCSGCPWRPGPEPCWGTRGTHSGARTELRPRPGALHRACWGPWADSVFLCLPCPHSIPVSPISSSLPHIHLCLSAPPSLCHPFIFPLPHVSLLLYLCLISMSLSLCAYISPMPHISLSLSLSPHISLPVFPHPLIPS